jgi:hypothetical protein
MSQVELPAQFADLAPFLEWSLATERERSAKRQAGSMATIEAFYAAMMPRMEAILTYLKDFPTEHEAADVRCLFQLALAVAEVAPAVENFGQPSVVEGYDVGRFVALHD